MEERKRLRHHLITIFVPNNGGLSYLIEIDKNSPDKSVFY